VGTVDRATRENMRRLGFTHGEIEAIATEMKTYIEKPKRPSSLELAQQRYYARQKALRDGTPIPAWARKRAKRT